MIPLAVIFLIDDVVKRSKSRPRCHPNDIDIDIEHENNNRIFHFGFLHLASQTARTHHAVRRHFNASIPSIIDPINSWISFETARLEAARPPPSIPPIIDVSYSFNEASSMFFFSTFLTREGVTPPKAALVGEF